MVPDGNGIESRRLTNGARNPRLAIPAEHSEMFIQDAVAGMFLLPPC